MNMVENSLARDLLIGGGQIAKEVLGKDTAENRRRIYTWHELGLLPTFRMGGQIASTRSAIHAAIAERINTEPAKRRQAKAAANRQRSRR